MAGIPLSWNDPSLSGVTNSGSVTLKNGGALSYKSITDTGSAASVVGLGSFNLDHVRISSREGVRIGGDGDVTISNSYLESRGQGSDHADTIQIYAPGSSGNITITNTTIVAHDTAATAGMFVADDWSGTLTFNNVVFQGGPFGLRIAADSQDISVSLKDVYFVGPFGYDDMLFEEVKGDIHITQWENVRSATIVNGQLVPGALIKAPFPVEGGASIPAPELGAPTIDSLSDDSGVAGDGITNDNTIILTGKAAANSTVKVFDGVKQIGAVSAANDGAWSFKSAALPDGAHKFTATATSSGITSQASAARSVSVDTVAPTAPTLKMSTSAATLASTQVAQLTGTAEANSTVKVFDGSTQIGTATANSSGAWAFTTKSLANGGHNFTAKAMDVAGNTGAASTALAVTIAPSTPTAPATPKAPTIASFSQDSGVVGDHITNDNTLTLTGTAVANSTIKVYDGAKQVGITTANSSGSWSYTAAALSDAKHTLTATATDSQGKTSSASANLDVTIDTTAPTAPTIASTSGGTVQSATARATSSSNNVVKLTGTAESKSAIDVFDGSTKIGTATAAADGTWSFTTSQLSTGQHTFTAKATDIAGNIGKISTVLNVSVSSSTSEGPAAPPTPTPGKVIESAGATKLVESGDKYYLNSSSGSGPSLKYHGVDFVDGTDGTWAPIAAEKTTTGYQVVWKDVSTGLYTAWNTDNNGNYVSHVSTLTGSTSGGTVSGTNSGLKLLETSFHQDLNGDGQIGASSAGTPTSPTPTPGKIIESAGATSLVKSDDKYYLNSSSGSGPSLKVHGVAFVDGTDGTWAPIAAEKTTTGYQVVWKEASSALYTAWNTDNNGNYVSHVSTLTGSTSGGAVSGTNSGLKLLETSFHQDLNGDGQIGASSAAAPTQINSTDQVVATSGSGDTIVGTDRSDTLTSTTGNDIMVGRGGDGHLRVCFQLRP